MPPGRVRDGRSCIALPQPLAAVRSRGSRLLAVTGASLIMGGARPRTARSLRLLGLGSAAVLALVDVVYASRGRISRVYLADAALHTALGALWLLGDRRA